jgi:hypothetical protein
MDLVIFELTLVSEVLGNGGSQSSFTVIDVAYFIIIKYKLRKKSQSKSTHNNITQSVASSE